MNLNPERLKVMKKIYIVMAVVATVMFSSCEREKSFDNPTLGENELSFVMSGVATRTSADVPAPVKGVTIPFGTSANGEELFLEETIEELNPIPSTRGVPAYTVNVGTIYPEMGVFSQGWKSNGDATFSVMDLYDHKGTPSDPNAPITGNPDPTKGDGWRYHHNYASSPWPDDKKAKVDFYFRMPVSDSDVTDLEYANKKIDFHYVSPLSGSSQKDILFSYTSLSKEEHDGYLENGAPVLMQHALTGVKFRSGHSNAKTTHTIITKVEITGLKDTGDCTIDFTSTPSISWNASNNGKTFTQQFDNPDYEYTTDEEGEITVTSGDGTVDYQKGDSKFGDSWTSAAADHNLNDKDGSLTFWFIPQMLTTATKLKVTFVVKTPDTSGKDGAGVITHTINFGDMTRRQTKNDDGSITYGEYADWKAGQLRTYTLKPSDVDVDIFDHMEGMEKDSLHVTNTGNVDEFVRMMLVGNWYDDEGNILVGYKYKDTSDPNYIKDHDENPKVTVNDMVTPWYREEPIYSKYFDEETFKDGRPCGENPWVLGTGSYFYYPEIIGAGDKLAGTKALFQSYKLPESAIPTIWIEKAGTVGRVQATGVHLVMEVVVQAIGTTNPESPTGQAFGSWQEAWSYVTGKEIEAVED